MATLVIAGAGAMVGGMGWGSMGASVGWALGAYVGGLVFGEKPEDTHNYGPRLEDLTVQTSTYGSAIPKCYGSLRVGGNIIWTEGIKELSLTTESSGGKGGGPTTATTTYTYRCSFAVGLCEGEISGIRRIWADGKLMFDKSDTADYQTNFADTYKATSITVYTGSETQVADSVIEAVEGSGNVPGYRGLAYIVFEDLLLTDYGNRIPSIEVELASGLTEIAYEFDTPISDCVGIDYHVDAGVLYCKDIKSPNEETSFYLYDKLGSAADANLVLSIENFPMDNVLLTYSPVIVMDNSQSGLLLQFASNHPSEASSSVGSTATAKLTTEKILYETDGYITQYGYIIAGDLGRLEGYTSPWKKSFVCAVNISAEYFLKVYDYDGGLPGVKTDVSNPVLDVMISTPGEPVLDDITISEIINCGLRVYNNEIIIAIDGYGFDGVSQFAGILVFTTDSLPYADRAYNLGNNPSAGYTKFGYKMSGIAIDGFGNLCIQTIDDKVYVMDGISATQLTVTAYTDGNTVPVDIRDICNDVFDSCGLEVFEYDTSDIEPDSADTFTAMGYARTNIMPGANVLDPLMKIYQFDIVEVDWKLYCVGRGSDVSIDIPTTDLCAHESGSDFPEPIDITITEETNLPQEITLEYFDISADYQLNAESAIRSIDAVNSIDKEVLKYPIVLTSTQALQSVEAIMQTAWEQREKYKIFVSSEYAYLIPSGVITINSAEYKMLISKLYLHYPNLLEIEAVKERTDAYISTSDAKDPNYTSSTINLAQTTFQEFLDIPGLENTYTKPGFFIAAYGFQTGWTSATIYRSTDEGQSWNPVDAITSQSICGYITEALASGTTDIIDTGNTLNIKLNTYGGSLSSTTETNMLSGTNTAAVGADDRWEIISFQNATEESDGSYTIDTLIRGRRGTEWAIGNHEANDAFVLLEEDKLRFIEIGEEYIDVDMQYKIVSTGQTLNQTTGVTFASSAVVLKPYSPVSVAGTRGGTDDLTITWLRRSRTVTGWDYGNTPLCEETEQYEIDIYDGATVVRTIEIDGSPTATYTGAQQTTDFGSPQSSITMIIYQISTTVDRGYGTSATL